MPKKFLEITNCIDCPNHEVINDGDPHDWFCDDDVAVVCTKAENHDCKGNSVYAVERNPHQAITTACRPYNTRKECEVPSWCPL